MKCNFIHPTVPIECENENGRCNTDFALNFTIRSSNKLMWSQYMDNSNDLAIVFVYLIVTAKTKGKISATTVKNWYNKIINIKLNQRTSVEMRYLQIETTHGALRICAVLYIISVMVFILERLSMIWLKIKIILDFLTY